MIFANKLVIFQSTTEIFGSIIGDFVLSMFLCTNLTKVRFSSSTIIHTLFCLLTAHLPILSHPPLPVPTLLRSAARTERKLITDMAAEAGVSLRAMIDVKRRREKAVAERAGAVEAAASARVQHRYVMFELFRAEEAEFFRRHAMRSRFTQVSR